MRMVAPIVFQLKGAETNPDMRGAPGAAGRNVGWLPLLDTADPAVNAELGRNDAGTAYDLRGRSLALLAWKRQE